MRKITLRGSHTQKWREKVSLKSLLWYNKVNILTLIDMSSSANPEDCLHGLREFSILDTNSCIYSFQVEDENCLIVDDNARSDCSKWRIENLQVSYLFMIKSLEVELDCSRCSDRITEDPPSHTLSNKLLHKVWSECLHEISMGSELIENLFRLEKFEIGLPAVLHSIEKMNLGFRNDISIFLLKYWNHFLKKWSLLENLLLEKRFEEWYIRFIVVCIASNTLREVSPFPQSICEEVHGWFRITEMMRHLRSPRDAVFDEVEIDSHLLVIHTKSL